MYIYAWDMHGRGGHAAHHLPVGGSGTGGGGGLGSGGQGSGGGGGSACPAEGDAALVAAWVAIETAVVAPPLAAPCGAWYAAGPVVPDGWPRSHGRHMGRPSTVPKATVAGGW